MIPRQTTVDQNLDGYALHDFHEVTGCVLGGDAEKRAPLPAWMLSTCPRSARSGYASTSSFTASPARMRVSCCARMLHARGGGLLLRSGGVDVLCCEVARTST
jgi:hypothetical protein